MDAYYYIYKMKGVDYSFKWTNTVSLDGHDFLLLNSEDFINCLI